MPRRIALVVSADGEELASGRRDALEIFTLFIDPDLGHCDAASPSPIVGCSTRAEFGSQWQAVLHDWQPVDQLLFYFSGHGSMKHGKYALVFGSPPTEQYLPFDNLTSDLHVHGVRRAVIILDACHSGAATKPGVKGNAPLPQIEESLPEGIVVLTSCRDFEQSFELEGGARGSVFTRLLIEAIETGLGGRPTADELIGPNDIVEYVHTRLSDEAYAKYPQTPTYQVSSANRSVWIARNRARAVKPAPAEEARSTRTLGELHVLYERTERSRHPCPGVSVEDLDWQLVEKYAEASGAPLRRGESREQAARRLGFFSSLSESGLHIAAVLCFAQRPHLFLPQARSIFVRGRRSGREVRRVDVLGPLPRQVEQLAQLISDELNRNLAWRSSVANEELLSFVVREAVSNAIVHRDYASSELVQVSADLPAVEFTNPGAFPKGATFEDILDAGHYSIPNDAAIAWYMTTLLAYEGVGRGFSVYREFRKLMGSSSLQCHENQKLGFVKLTLHLIDEARAAEVGSELLCPRCSKANQPHYRFCLHCGRELPATAAVQNAPKYSAPNVAFALANTETFCNSCGTGNPMTLNFCRECGARLKPLTGPDAQHDLPQRHVAGNSYVNETSSSSADRESLIVGLDSGHDDPRLGMLLGDARYRLVAPIGSGGTGTVYEAHDLRLGRTVAIKLVSKRFVTLETQRRVAREATLAARVDHPGIVRIYDAASEQEHMYIVMELVRGMNLAEFIIRSSHSASPSILLFKAAIVRDIAEALAAAHEVKVIHRDVKPGNVIVDDTGRARVLDFGISRALETRSDSSITATGTMVGTLHYMCPEQVQGAATDARSDVYSLGVVMYELLTGQTPFEGDGVDLAVRIATTDAPRPRARVPAIPDALDEICWCAMRRDPDARFNTASALAARLAAYIQAADPSGATDTQRLQCWESTLQELSA